MGRFLLQKNMLLMHLILLGYYAAFFPVKFPQITPAKHCIKSGGTHRGRVYHHWENGAGHRLFFTVKNRGVAASKTRSPPICSNVLDIPSNKVFLM